MTDKEWFAIECEKNNIEYDEDSIEAFECKVSMLLSDIELTEDDARYIAFDLYENDLLWI